MVLVSWPAKIRTSAAGRRVVAVERRRDDHLRRIQRHLGRDGGRRRRLRRPGLVEAFRRLRQLAVRRRFDFEPEAAVRLVWRGVPAVNVPAPVRYLTAREGGVSHFRYVRDNILLTGMHIRLMLAAIFLHLPTLLRLRGKRQAASRR